MAALLPFQGLTYSTSRVPDLQLVVTPPYDVISPEKDEEYRRRHLHNIAHVILPRPEGGTDKYHHAAQLLEEWQREGILVRDEKPCLYVVSQRYTMKGIGQRTRLGLIARVRIEDEGGGILPHERTMDAPREDRLQLLAATQTNLSQVLLLHRDPGGKIEALVESVASHPADRWAVDDSGTESSLWRISDPGRIDALCRSIEGQTLWIADGHHRYAAARALRDRLRRADGSPPGSRSYDYVMAVLASMDSEGVTILPYHRSLRVQEGLDEALFTEKAREYFDLKEFAFESFASRAEQIRRKLRDAGRSGQSAFAAYMGHGSFLLLLLRDALDRSRLMGDAIEETLQELDASVLHHVLLEKALGIPAEIQRQQGGPLRYTDDIDHALAWVDSNEAQVALLLNPTLKEQLLAVCRAGLQMPQKSTYFYPKVLTGLVLNPLDPVERILVTPSHAARAG